MRLLKRVNQNILIKKAGFQPALPSPRWSSLYPLPNGAPSSTQKQKRQPASQMFFMWFKGLVGGRLQSYDAVLDFGRREVLLRLKQQADSLGCTSMQNIRLETSVVSFAKNSNESRRSSVEFLAFATGIRQ